MKNGISCIIAAGAILAAITSSDARANSIEAVPSGWRLEGYVSSHSVNLWYTGAPECQNGGLSGAAMSQDDFDRLFSLIMTSKLANRPVGIIYQVAGGSCNITSFYAP